jgi:hypothetical protein
MIAREAQENVWGQVVRVVDVADQRLPGILGVRLSRPGWFGVHLLDQEPVPARDGDMVGVADHPGQLAPHCPDPSRSRKWAAV